MRKSRYTEEQIVGNLRESEAGVATGELCTASRQEIMILRLISYLCFNRHIDSDGKKLMIDNLRSVVIATALAIVAGAGCNHSPASTKIPSDQPTSAASVHAACNRNQSVRCGWFD